MERDQFTFYRSFWKALKALPKKDQLPFVLAIGSYVFEGETKTPTGAAAASFLLVKPILDKASKKAESGKTGGSKSKANRKQTESKTESNAKQTESYIEGEGEKEGEREEEREVEVEIEYEYTPIPPTNAAEAKWKNDGFETFWAAYPSKTGLIDQAYRQYLLALGSGVTLDELMSALEWQAAEWAKQESRYTPSAEKWLRNKGWTARRNVSAPKSFAEMWEQGVTE